MFSFKSFLKSCLFLLLLQLSAPIWAQQVKKVAFQGFLKDANGRAVADRPHTVTFKLYKTATLGTAEWTSTQEVIVFGVFIARFWAVLIILWITLVGDFLPIM